MPRYKIEGGQPLEGTITISGAKNAAVAIIPATLLVQGCCRIENVPDISDVHILLDILKQMALSVCQRSHDTVEIDCTNVAIWSRTQLWYGAFGRRITSSGLSLAALGGRGWLCPVAVILHPAPLINM